MKEFVEKWSAWWRIQPNHQQLTEAFRQELTHLLGLDAPPASQYYWVKMTANSAWQPAEMRMYFGRTCFYFTDGDRCEADRVYSWRQLIAPV